MAHNMEVIDGVTSFARADTETRPWWAGMDNLGEGQVFVKGTDWSQVAGLANLNHEVRLHEMATVMDDNTTMMDKEGSKFYRPARTWNSGPKDGQTELIGRGFTERYGLVQVKDMAEIAKCIETIMPGAHVATAGGLRNGNRAFITVRLGQVKVDVNNYEDVTNLYLSILNSWDGSSPFAIINGSFRTVCDNTYSGNLAKALATMQAEKGSRRGNFISGKAVLLKHVGNMEDKLEAAKVAITEEMGWAEAYQTYAQELARVKMTTQQFKKMVKALVPEPKETGSLRTDAMNTNNHERKLDLLTAEWNKENKERGGATAWGALNSFTAFTTHYSVAKGTKLSPGVELESRVFGDTITAGQGRSLVDQVSDYLKDFSLAKV